ncbi:hypothetical protein FDA94_05865 [Herbidospora galbida]|uniref:Uncharacterized protein n=1 Tax=Herbidospora galbida TaxID=2575442 RepID=A0A4U3MNR5_9ACTN|nr:hypothetical protein [Herbidospora galbida]TKK90519.1 hypothetical protein FDA94_05865 [Herbidospora galbida]
MMIIATLTLVPVLMSGGGPGPSASAGITNVTKDRGGITNTGNSYNSGNYRNRKNGVNSGNFSNVNGSANSVNASVASNFADGRQKIIVIGGKRRR